MPEIHIPRPGFWRVLFWAPPPPCPLTAVAGTSLSPGSTQTSTAAALHCVYWPPPHPAELCAPTSAAVHV